MDNINLLVYKMLKVREISMVIHTWRRLHSYNDVGFISNISSILEFISKDLNSQSTTFNTSHKLFVKLKELVDMVNSSKRKVFFGLFNDADSLGMISRHGASKHGNGELREYNQVSSKHIKEIEVIRENMLKGIMPNEREFKHMYNVWHLTTSLIVFLWFATKKVN